MEAYSKQGKEVYGDNRIQNLVKIFLQTYFRMAESKNFHPFMQSDGRATDKFNFFTFSQKGKSVLSSPAYIPTPGFVPQINPFYAFGPGLFEYRCFHFSFGKTRDEAP